MNAKEALEMKCRAAEAQLSELRVTVRSSLGRARGFDDAVELIEGDEGQASLRKKLEDKARRERQAAAEAEQQQHELEALVSAYQDVIKMFAKDAEDQSSPELRPGSELHRVRDFILEQKRPVDIADLLRLLGKTDNPETRNSLRGSIGRYARNGTIFVKTAPNQFGLISLGHKPSNMEDPVEL